MSGLTFLILPATYSNYVYKRNKSFDCSIEYGGSCIINNTDKPEECTERVCDINVPPEFCLINT